MLDAYTLTLKNKVKEKGSFVECDIYFISIFCILKDKIQKMMGENCCNCSVVHMCTLVTIRISVILFKKGAGQIYPVVCPSTSFLSLPQQVLHRVQFISSYFKSEYYLVSLSSSSSCLRFLPCLP